MKCEGCGRDLRDGALFCTQCGAQVPSADPYEQASADLDRISTDLQKMEDELSAEVDAATAALDRELAALTGEGPAAEAGPQAPADRGAAALAGTPLVHEAEWIAVLEPPVEQIFQSASFVFHSPAIQTNPQYAARIAQIRFLFLPEDDTVNAFATDESFSLADGRRVEPPAVVFQGGLARVIRLVSVALAAHLRCRRERVADTGGGVLAETFGQVGLAITRLDGNFPWEASCEIFRQVVLPRLPAEDERYVSLSRSCSAAMEMYTVAHEAGHIALAHTLGRDLNYDMSRNQEREADSFAASALSTCPFREYLFLGQVFVAIVFAWIERAASARRATSHPLGRERFANAMHSSSEAAREAAEQFGLTREALEAMLPPQGATTA